MTRQPGYYPIMVMVLLSALLQLTACNSENGFVPAPGTPVLVLTPIVNGFVQPVHIAHAGDGSDRMFIVERAGRVRVITDGAIRQAPFLDIADRVLSDENERGLLSIAFPPDFDDSGEFYVYYTGGTDGRSVLSRFLSNGEIANPASEEILLEIPQPAPNHNGGQIAFGPDDGYLYIALGDGGGSGDQFNQAQDTSTLLGALLRIDVAADAPAPYGIPPDNPFLDIPAARKEIWAFGLRNPWRFSFDRANGDLYIGDVGQGSYEEIDFQPAGSPGGENYGWSLMEGLHCFPATITNCARNDLVLPVAEYAHVGGGCSGSVSGGFVYRGTDYPGLQGYYLYGDFCTGRIRGFRMGASGPQQSFQFDSALAISTFGEDEAGELYIADYLSGNLYRIGTP